MISKVNKGASLASQIKQLKKAIAAADKDPFLYQLEEIHFMKRSLRRLQEVVSLAKKAQKGGFGYDV
ncbi:hypothetical protein [Synechococcus phage S-MS29]|nr:hypothetical protein [Synechococcus phage S-MS29]|tara:strand:- start:13 stop:213 length:201 start_codon:yes stop_codon:yes gene_type:complete